ncbi:E3 ubiquitin-protein ligase ATL23-like [Impatiens glandulifera]|uniref:E3 ubiquitin-protein ligase ATL23-like n=1 Tax=Impatiens glandulifera TaxID=253017 RepID=UPI001FB076D5|nr:E3 ubiquitin-protein ligase ATL23-like [Impatiens glandulifera]
MLLSVFLALFLPCVGMSAVFIVYVCLLWYAATNTTPVGSEIPMPEKTNKRKGLSDEQLEKIPKITGKELVLGSDCAVCLDEIEDGQIARLIPGCNHGFHIHCADAWLAVNSVCPICRGQLDTLLIDPPDNNPC